MLEHTFAGLSRLTVWILLSVLTPEWWPNQCSSDCDPRTRSTGVTWELVRNAASQAPSGPPDSETLGLGPSTPCFNKSSRWFWCTFQFALNFSLLLWSAYPSISEGLTFSLWIDNSSLKCLHPCPSPDSQSQWNIPSSISTCQHQLTTLKAELLIVQAVSLTSDELPRFLHPIFMSLSCPQGWGGWPLDHVALCLWSFPDSCRRLSEEDMSFRRQCGPMKGDRLWSQADGDFDTYGSREQVSHSISLNFHFFYYKKGILSTWHGFVRMRDNATTTTFLAHSSSAVNGNCSKLIWWYSPAIGLLTGDSLALLSNKTWSNQGEEIMSLDTDVLYDFVQVVSPLWVSASFSVKWRERAEQTFKLSLSTPELLDPWRHMALCWVHLRQARESLWMTPCRRLRPAVAGVFQATYLALGRCLTEQGREPVDIGFTVWVQECDNIPRGCWGPQHPGPYQPFPFFGSENPHTGEMGHVVFKWLLQVLCERDRRGQINRWIWTAAY